MPQYHIRPLVTADQAAIEMICNSSAWSFQNFTAAELPRLLATRPGSGVFALDKMIAFMLTSSVVPPSAWLGGFGITWSEQRRAMEWFDAMLPQIIESLRARGARTLYYSGYDPDNDWLRASLLERGFAHLCWLRSYDKIGYATPTSGNPSIEVRPFDQQRDMAAIVAIEEAAFEPLWRHHAAEFREIAAEYPFFIVALTPDGTVVGYQFSSMEFDLGYLVRIAVHPLFQGQGIGARLMVAAMQFFAAHKVVRILLNTEETNHHAHRLYEWFGFKQVEPQGFVLARPL